MNRVELNNEIKKRIRHAIGIMAGNDEVLQVIENWDIENPSLETEVEIRNFCVKKTNETKDKMIFLRDCLSTNV